jgi:hypothetical protein
MKYNSKKSKITTNSSTPNSSESLLKEFYEYADNRVPYVVNNLIDGSRGKGPDTEECLELADAANRALARWKRIGTTETELSEYLRTKELSTAKRLAVEEERKHKCEQTLHVTT